MYGKKAEQYITDILIFYSPAKTGVCKPKNKSDIIQVQIIAASPAYGTSPRAAKD